jgi:hypothetical protein
MLVKRLHMTRNQRRQKLLGDCAFCGQPATTEDHIPPQGMFAPGTPDLMWVPACDPCNKSTTKDDEFFQRLAFVAGTERSADALAVRETVLRAIERPQARATGRTSSGRSGWRTGPSE